MYVIAVFYNVAGRTRPWEIVFSGLVCDLTPSIAAHGPDFSQDQNRLCIVTDKKVAEWGHGHCSLHVC